MVCYMQTTYSQIAYLNAEQLQLLFTSDLPYLSGILPVE